MTTHPYSPSIEEEFRKKKIDRDLSLSILERFNRGDFSHIEPVRVRSIPRIDGKQIVDLSGIPEFTVPLEHAQERLSGLIDTDRIRGFGTVSGKNIRFKAEGLENIGLLLLPFTAYGILNGGSASSYIDEKKNRSFSQTIYDITREAFSGVASMSRGNPKGTSPAFIHPDGTPGPSFLELKMRSLMLYAHRYYQMFGQPPVGDKGLGMLPLFQMTSEYTHTPITEALAGYGQSPLLAGLNTIEQPAVLAPLTAKQPLIAAYTHSSRGIPKQLFTEAHGRPDTLLPLPGGHGQNFSVLADIYRKLYSGGKRFAVLGNIDNLGNTLNPKALAVLALSGAQGAFEFSFRTAVDVKGGILVRDQKDRLNAADIGPAVSKEDVRAAEQSGASVLFNCATGIFDLKYFSEHIDEIADRLPIRFSDQNKDAGMYSQAEQITWEVIGMLDSPLILAVNKYERFLAAKLLLESLMTSAIRTDHPEYPADMQKLSLKLHAGLNDLLTGPYGMRLLGKRWEPVYP